jgi:hypothetical protein
MLTVMTHSVLWLVPTVVDFLTTITTLIPSSHRVLRFDRAEFSAVYFDHITECIHIHIEIDERPY